MQIGHYATPDGRDTFAEWLGSVTDLRARAAVAMRIGRLRRGLLGDWRRCRAGVVEMRIDAGPGYRAYLARLPLDRVLLICGGTKRTQGSDIDRAVQLLRGLPGTQPMSKPDTHFPSRPHDEAMAEMLRKDPEFAARYLNLALEEGDQEDLLVVLKHLARAFGGVSKVASASGLNPTSLYRTLSRRGNPELRSLIAILRAMGFRLAVEPIAKRRSGRARKIKAA